MRFAQVHLSLQRGGANTACENIERGLSLVGHQCRTVTDPDALVASNADHVLFHSFTPVSAEMYLKILDTAAKIGVPVSVLLHDYWPICEQTNLADRNRGWETCSLNSPCDHPCVSARSLSREIGQRVLDMNLVCFSEIATGIMRKAGATKVETIAHGIDINSFRPITKQNEIPVLLFCNAWGTKSIKGYKHWEWIKGKTQSRCIEAKGEINHSGMPAFYASGDAMVFPSLWPETFGLVVIESLACGKPVLSYPVGIAPEAITSGVNGFLTESSNPAEMLDAIKVFSDIGISARETMSEEARKTAETHFSLEIMAEKYVSMARRASE